MLLALSCNIVGILRQLCNVQQHRRMAQRCWVDTTNFHAVELHRAANAKDEKSLPVSVSDRCSHYDLSRIHHPPRSEP
jgi:hypothetical protein